MAAAPHPTPHLQQHLEQSPEQRRAADIIRLLSLYRPLLDAFVIVSVPKVSLGCVPPLGCDPHADPTPRRISSPMACGHSCLQPGNPPWPLPPLYSWPGSWGAAGARGLSGPCPSWPLPLLPGPLPSLGGAREGPRTPRARARTCTRCSAATSSPKSSTRSSAWARWVPLPIP